MHIVVTPAKNEAAHLPDLIASMRVQTRRPDLWLIVDDGSTDATAHLVEKAACSEAWIRLVRADLPGGRNLGARVAQLVLWGLDQAKRGDWDFFSKIDADLTLPPDYFAQVLTALERDPKLGIAGGACYVRRGGQLRMEEVAAEHTRGALKTYRRACWDAIGGVRPVNGWDGLDGILAEMRGFHTKHLPEVVVEHHRPTGGFDGLLRGKFRAGRFAHYLGYHPLYMLARSLWRMRDWPWLLGGMAMQAGYLYEHLRKQPVVDEPDVVSHLRKKQLAKVGLAWLARDRRSR